MTSETGGRRFMRRHGAFAHERDERRVGADAGAALPPISSWPFIPSDS